jgi:hypothetical protein
MTKTKKPRADITGRLAVFPADAALVRMLTALTGETQAEVVARLLRGAVARQLRGQGQDPDRVVALHEAASRG